MNKKICFVAQFPPPVHGLSKAVQTLFDSPELNSTFELEGINITSNSRFPANLWRILRSKADLFYFTISQTKGGNLRDLIILRLLSLRRKKCLIHLHGGYYRKLVDNDLPGWQRKANFRAMSRLAGAVVLGKSLRPIFHDMLPEEKIFVVPNCVDDEFLMREEDFETKLSALGSKDTLRVLYLSNFIRSKGYPEVLELALKEKERCDGGAPRRLHFDFAGGFFDDSEKEFFFGYIRDHSLDGYVTYHGIVGGEEKKRLLAESDIFVLLTRYPNEGQPISILEAMGNGLSVVTTDHAGIPDVVTDGVNGTVLPSADLHPCPEHLSTSEQIARTNRSLALESYSQRAYVANMKAIFERLCQQDED